MTHEHDLQAGPRLTPTMEALLQAADCFVSPEPIPAILLSAPLVSRGAREAPAALEGLLRAGWLTEPVPGAVLLSPRSQALLASRHSDEPIQVMVVQALCITVSRLVEAHDAATLRLVEPHLRALNDAWQPRGDRYAMALSLAMATYLRAVGRQNEASSYLERARALDELLGARAASPARPWWRWW